MIDIHLVSWNRPKMTDLVIKTIHRNTKPENFRLVVLDNGSDPETVEMLQQHHDNGRIDELVLWDTNYGLEPARTHLLNECTQSEYFVCADNDCLPEPMTKEHTFDDDWIDKLYRLITWQSDYAAIACRYPVMVGTGNIYEQADETDEEIVEFPHPGGSLRIMRTDLVKQTGGWRKDVGSRGTEERYICGKLHELGYKTGFAVNVRTLHLFGLKDTDNWGYDKKLTPEDTGHSSGVWHPIFDRGDVYEEIVEFTGEKLAKEYCE